jgi:hypothetical protein
MSSLEKSVSRFRQIATQEGNSPAAVVSDRFASGARPRARV